MNKDQLKVALNMIQQAQETLGHSYHMADFESLISDNTLSIEKSSKNMQSVLKRMIENN